MRAIVTKSDGTQDVFGMCLNPAVDCEAIALTIDHWDGNAKQHVKHYGCGQWKTVTFDATAPDDSSLCPPDAVKV